MRSGRLITGKFITSGTRQLISVCIAAHLLLFVYPLTGQCQEAPKIVGAKSDIGKVALCRAVIIVRHADRDGTKDALIVPKGGERATTLATILSGAGITKAFVSTSKRTEDTAAPLIRNQHILKFSFHEHGDTAKDIINCINTQLSNNVEREVILVVAHSHQIPGLVEALGFGPPTVNGGDSFDRMFVICGEKNSRPRNLISLLYGKPTGPVQAYSAESGLDTYPIGRATNSDSFLDLTSKHGLKLGPR